MRDPYARRAAALGWLDDTAVLLTRRLHPHLRLHPTRARTCTHTCPRGSLPHRLCRTGMSLLLPSGWIHAVFTPQDSCVLGWNWLPAAQLPWPEQSAGHGAGLAQERPTKPS